MAKNEDTPPKVEVKEDSGLSKKRAEILAREVEEMILARVQVTPKNLLARAVDEASPLHALFEWDDSVAASQFRIIQARRLISSVVIVVQTVDHPVRAYYSVPVGKTRSEGEREYIKRDVLLADADGLASVSNDRYTQMQGLARDIDALGLSRADIAWRTICRAITTNVPQAVRNAERSAQRTTREAS